MPDWRRDSLFRFLDQRDLRIVIEDAQGRDMKKDVPISFSPFRREYRYRYRREMRGKIVKKRSYSVSTEHDPMVELGED